MPATGVISVWRTDVYNVLVRGQHVEMRIQQVSHISVLYFSRTGCLVRKLLV